MSLIFLSLLASSWGLVTPDQQVTTRDVCVIGGGSAGTYAAVRLQEMNQSVVVVEKTGRLGGQTETYVDPETNIAVEYGVIFLDNITVVHNYFGSLGVPLKPVSIAGDVQPRGVDLRSGTIIGDPQGNLTEGMARYASQLLRYPYLANGFDLPWVVPRDLLLPFGEFADKYHLGPAVEPIASVVGGVGDILRQSTLYVMKTFSLEVLQGVQKGFLGTQSGSNTDLYVAAQNRLEGNVLFNSTVAEMDRNNRDSNWVHVTVQSRDGRQLVKARRILFAIPPKLDNLNGVDLDRVERDLFGQFSNTFYYTMLARIDGFPPNTAIVNRANDTRYHIPQVPSVYSIRSSRVPGLYNIWYGSEHSLTEDEVKADVVATIQRLQAVDIHASTPEFVAFSAHQPFQLTVPSKAIARGFYRRLQTLQGRSRTFYTGATFETHDSARIWRFTEDLLQTMVRGL